MPVDPTELARRVHRGEWVVDLRQRRAFAAEHPGGPEQWSPSMARGAYPVIRFEQVLATNGIVLDVRRDDERRSSHIVGSVHVPIDQLLRRYDELPDATALVHCVSGFRASIAASLLDRAGRSVVLIDDDYEQARPAGLEITGSP